MLNFKDIMRYVCATVIYLYKYIKDLFKMNSVYDCARPFMLVAGIFGMGGSKICEIEGVRSVRNTRFSLIIAALITLFITPVFFIMSFNKLFSVEQRPLVLSTALIILVGQYAFAISTTAVTCIRSHVYCKNLAKVLQILNNTDMMLKQQNIQVNYWRIILKTILFGLMSCNYYDLYKAVGRLLRHYGDGSNVFAQYIVKLFMDIACESYFMLIILFMLIIRERFVGLNKLLLQNAQVPSIIQDDSLLRRISLARDIHEQLSEAIELFSDISRFLIIGVLVPPMLLSLLNALTIVRQWNETVFERYEGNEVLLFVFVCFCIVVYPIMKIVILTAVCETHKNNRRVLTARLRRLIAREEDPRVVHQLKQYILFNHDTVAGLVDLQLVDVDFTLLFTVIDIIVSYVLVIHSHYRT